MISESAYIDEHSKLNVPMDLIVNAWFEYWIDLKKETVRPNTVRNYSERYERNIKSDIGKPTKKKEASKSGYRKVPLTDEAISILKRQKEKHKDIKVIPMEWVDFVFLCRKGSPIKNSTYDTALFKICDKADIPRFSMHVLRHTFATRCIEGGMKPKTLQMILGHSNIGITMNLYVHTTEEEKFKEIQLVADVLNAM